MLKNLALNDSTDINEALSIIAKNSPNLLALTVSGKIKTSTVKIIAKHCHQLMKLSLGNEYRLTDAALVALGTNCPNLIELPVICFSVAVTTLGLRALTQGCRKLTSIALVDSSDEGMIAVAENGKELTSFSIYACGAITDASFQAIGRHCSNLTSINVVGYPVACAGFSALARGCRKMKYVYIGSLSDITALNEQWPSLCSFEMKNAETLTDTELEVLSRCCPNLESISLHRCSSITSVGLAALASNCPNLKEKDIQGIQGTQIG